MAYTCIIVDDEPLAIKVLTKYISTTPHLEISGTCQNGFEALNLLSKGRVDLMFLDIIMPELIGTELIKTLNNPPKVIFTTANRDYAIEAFELDAVDYLIKPFSFTRFLKAVNKVLPAGNPLTKPSNGAIDHIYLRADRKMIKVTLDKILYMESYRDYVRIHLEESRELKVKSSLNQVESMLPKSQFLRIHRSYIVPHNKITAFTKTDVEIGKIELPIGKSFTHAFYKLIPKGEHFPEGVTER